MLKILRCIVNMDVIILAICILFFVIYCVVSVNSGISVVFDNLIVIFTKCFTLI